MRENPYTQLLSAMENMGSRGNPSVYFTGRVSKEAPLEITALIDGQKLNLEAEDLMVDARLKQGYSRPMTCGEVSGKAQFTQSDLKEGATVLMIPSFDKQTSDVVCVLEAP